MIKTTAKKIYIILIFIFLYAPIATLMVFSFNSHIHLGGLKCNS